MTDRQTDKQVDRQTDRQTPGALTDRGRNDICRGNSKNRQSHVSFCFSPQTSDCLAGCSASPPMNQWFCHGWIRMFDGEKSPFANCFSQLNNQSHPISKDWWVKSHHFWWFHPPGPSWRLRTTEGHLNVGQGRVPVHLQKQIERSQHMRRKLGKKTII